MREKVEAVLSKIRPGLGGTSISLVDIRDGVVRVEIFVSSCASGVSEEMAVELLEEELAREVPEVKEVVAV
jgi:Fe-S cluster biogenesis protein NfuA